MTKYNCPICGSEMFESNFCNMRSCRWCQMSVDVKVLDAVAAKDARIAELEKERDMYKLWWIGRTEFADKTLNERDEAHRDVLDLASRIIGSDADILLQVRAVEMQEKYK